MRIAYLDCFAGISGDMFLGALLDAGVPREVFEDAVHALGIGASLKIERVDRSGITATRVVVLDGGVPAEAAVHGDLHTHAHTHAESPVNGALEQGGLALSGLQPQLKTQHQHKGGHHPHTHTHSHDEHEHAEAEPHTHVHGRSLTQIRTLLEKAPLQPTVRQTAIRTFELLGQSEAKIHNVPVDEIHFHEVGAVDAIVDIVAASAGIVHLNVGAWYSSALNTGSGMVQCAHGNFPVPAPATADLLRGMPTYAAHVQKELITPTGAALLRTLQPTFAAQPAMRVDSIGYGAGTRNPEGFPNVLRISLGESEASATSTRSPFLLPTESNTTDTVTVLETALDDATPQLLGFVTEQLLAQGALDVMLAPVVMKKGRPGTLLTVLATPAGSEVLQELLLRETTTLGLRIRQEQRVCLQREHAEVQTAFGAIRVKLGLFEQELRNLTPEYEDCKAAALAHGVPLKQVQQAALSAYLQSRPA